MHEGEVKKREVPWLRNLWEALIYHGLVDDNVIEIKDGARVD